MIVAFRFVLCLILISLTVGSVVEATDLKDLIGLWKTPGGNIIEIRKDKNGYLVEVTEDSKSVGYRVGQILIENININANTISFRVNVRGEDPMDEKAKALFKGGSLRGNSLVGELQDGYYDKNNNYVTENSFSQLIYTRKIAKIFVSS